MRLRARARSGMIEEACAARPPCRTADLCRLRCPHNAQGAPSVQMKQMPQDAYMHDVEDGGLKVDGTEAEREPGAGVGPARHRNDF